jgi:hypothetical protein
MSSFGLRLIQTNFPERPGLPSTMRARRRPAWRSRISLCLSWRHLRVRPDPPQYQPRIVPTGSRVSVHCSTYEWQSVREGNGTSRDLSQRSRGSHYRSYGTGCGTPFADCRPPDPSVQSGSDGLVRTLGNREVALWRRTAGSVKVSSPANSLICSVCSNRPR